LTGRDATLVTWWQRFSEADFVPLAGCSRPLDAPRWPLGPSHPVRWGSANAC
jgi:hypothetical protein